MDPRYSRYSQEMVIILEAGVAKSQADLYLKKRNMALKRDGSKMY